MLRFDQTKIATKKIYDAKNPINIWDVNHNNIVVSKLIKTKTNSRYLQTGITD